MFIPTPVQELHLPLTQKLEVGPVLPVTAVPGVAEEAQSLDSRVALQWTQPVFAGAEVQAGRSALVAPIPEALLKSTKTAVPGYEPQGADPDALKSGDVHPLLAQGLSSWLSGVLAQSNGNANVTSILPNLVLPMAKASEQSSENTALKATSNEASGPNASAVMGQLKNIFQAIASSDVFAAQRLNEAWMPRKLEPKHTPKVDSLKNSDAEAFQHLAQPIQEPSAKQLAQWVSALEPDSGAAEEAARMLTHGNMVWQVELLPGVPLRIIREDAWRNNPEQAGQLEKGAMLKVEVKLPNLGSLRIVGSQWGQDISLHISHGKQDVRGNVNWTTLASELLQELKTQGLQDVKIESLPDPADTHASNDLLKESTNA
jgi:hypothetical protein